MTLPAYPNIITMAQVNTELGRASNAAINLNETAVRTLAGVPSGIITMHDLHGKSAAVLAFNSADTLWSAIASDPSDPDIYIGADGTISAGSGRSYSGPTGFLSPTGAGGGGNYEMRVYCISSGSGYGSLFVDSEEVMQATYSSWFSLDATRRMYGARKYTYSVRVVGTLYIRKKDLSESGSRDFWIDT